MLTSDLFTQSNELPDGDICASDSTHSGPFALILDGLDHDIRKILQGGKRDNITQSLLSHKRAAIVKVELCLEGTKVLG
jgi:hypothetical protein